MKIIGLMLARNEEWILRASIPAALGWVDQLVVLDHASTDRTPEILDDFQDEYPGRIERLKADADEWDEMDHRQATLETGREMGGTHFAVCDADEILTANWLPYIRDIIEQLKPGAALDLPMIPAWDGLDTYCVGGNRNAEAWVTLAFADKSGLCWQARGGYQHHARPPRDVRYFHQAAEHPGGVMHLQFVSRTRLLAKQAWYKMIERVRWPDRESAESINAKYDETVADHNVRTACIPPEWWGEYNKDAIDVTGAPWHTAECRKMIDQHGTRPFKGLGLYGVI